MFPTNLDEQIRTHPADLQRRAEQERQRSNLIAQAQDASPSSPITLALNALGAALEATGEALQRAGSALREPAAHSPSPRRA
jgi:indole-3-glycerol phosphate synthase